MTKPIKIALAMIVKGSEEESKSLYRCLSHVIGDVDGVFITITHKVGEKRNDDVDDVCKSFNEPSYTSKNGKIKYDWQPGMVKVSDFEWCDDFAGARNFNFAQVPEEFTHILWCDADDVYRGLERLKNIIQKPQNQDADGFGIWYLYHFDEYKQADVVHKKTMVIRNPKGNKWGEWKGELHEEFVSLLTAPKIVMIDKFFNGGIDRMHLVNETEGGEKIKRNLRISGKMAKLYPDEPRNLYNYAQSLHGAGKYKESISTYIKFIKHTGSEEEKFLSNIRISEAYFNLKKTDDALHYGYLALGMRPEYPDGYFNIGLIMHHSGRLDDAEKYYLMGLKMRPKYNDIIVYNPRDYDYNPMRKLIQIYKDKGRPDLGMPFMEACLQIYPNNNSLKDEHTLLKSEYDRLIGVSKKLEEFKKLNDNDLKNQIESLPEDLRSHPGICALYNSRFIKNTSNGNEVVIYCYPTAFDWNPELFKTKGFGGSEEAVVNLSQGLSELGFDVTVYNRCGPTPKKHGKVWWKPFWMWNYRDKIDHLIIWRHPKPLDFELGADHVYVDLHDVVPPEEFTKERIKKATKFFVKTKFHRSLFPNIPDEKIAVIPNGQDNSLFSDNVLKDPYLLINTSSPDRSMDVLPELFMEVKKQVPQAKLKWAYGWDNYNDLFKSDPLRQKWKKEVEEKIKRAGIECLGKIPQKDVAKLYEKASILAYPSEFAEIDCISVKKAQYARCVPVTTDFGAFDESVQFGVKVHSKKNNKNWSVPYQMGYGLTDPKMKKEWVDAVVNILTNGSGIDPDNMRRWANQFSWDKIAEKWSEVLKCV